MPSTRTLLFLALATIIWYAAFSVIAFAAFAIDKALSRRQGARRIPERTLHTLSVLGGFPGAILAMRLVRHKSSKPPFILATLAIAAAHTILWIGIIILLILKT